MDITPAIPNGMPLIESYSERGFRISGTLHEGGVLVCSDLVRPLSAPPHSIQLLSALTVADFLPLLTLNQPPTLILLGTGATQQFASPALRAELRAKGLALESMTSAAACRTYNVLVAEGRLVAAVLLPL